HLPSALPAPNAKEKLWFFDDPNLALAKTGQIKRFELEVAGGKELRLCLVWTDAPGRSLQNNLNLLCDPPAPGGARGKKRTGNGDIADRVNPLDADNNVEIIRIDDPPPGTYRVQIVASNLLKPPQDFALVALGEITSMQPR